MPSEPPYCFRPTKTRRHVSTAVNNADVDDLVRRLKPYDDLFDEIIISSFSPVKAGEHKTRYPPEAHRKLVAECHAMEMSTINCHGWGYTKECQEVLSDPAAVRRAVEHMVELCETSGADGLDVDFEAWPAHTRFAHQDIVAQLSEDLHRRGKFLTVSVYPGNTAQRRERGLGFIDTHAIAPLVDRFHVMTYDLYCPPGLYIGPTSTTPWARDGMLDMLKLAPGYKLSMGLPTYSIDWDMTDPSKSCRVSDAALIAECEKKSPIGRGWCFYWDVGLIRYTGDDGHIHVLYVSDARSTASHLQTADALDVGGVFFWVFHSREDQEFYRTVRRHFQR